MSVGVTPGLPATQAEIGPFITGADVETALIDTLRPWLPAYLAAGERTHGLEPGTLPRPRGWAVTGRDMVEKFTSDQVPCIVVMARGILVKPLARGYPGAMTCLWSLDVGTIFNAAWGRDSRAYAQLYARAISLVLLQRPLEGLAGVVDFAGEDYDEGDFAETRTYALTRGAFTVQVEAALWREGGPPPQDEPPDIQEAPLDDWTRVVKTEVEVTNTPPS